MSSSESTALQSLSFEEHPVRIVLDDSGEPRWVAKDVAEALGYSWKGIATIEHVPAKWRGVYSVQTPSGMQEMLCFSEQGLYWFLGRSDKDAALPFQEWIAGDVIPSIRKTGQYAVKQMTAGEILLAQAQAMVEQERRTSALETRVAAIESRRIEAEREMFLLPAPAEPAEPLTDRARINRLVRQHAEETQLEHSAVWKQLYCEFRDRYHVDLRARARLGDKGTKPLDIAEELALLPQLYATAWALYGKQ
jgi:prophage antirepressor-like protein